MDFGMPTLIEYESVSENAELCSKLGLDFLELNMNLPFCQNFDGNAAEYLNETAEKYGIYYTLHFDENADFCNFNPIIKQGWQKVLINTLAAAQALKIPIVNMHLNRGVWFTLPDEKVFLYEKYNLCYENSICQLREICSQYSGNVKVSIENTNGFKPFEIKAIENLLNEKSIGLTWDVGHCHAAENHDESFFMKNTEKLFHMHLHDAVGKNDHLVLGEGDINIAQRLRQAEKSECRCVVEVKTSKALEKSVT